jgi:hypothetical protein
MLNESKLLVSLTPEEQFHLEPLFLGQPVQKETLNRFGFPLNPFGPLELFDVIPFVLLLDRREPIPHPFFAIFVAGQHIRSNPSPAVPGAFGDEFHHARLVVGLQDKMFRQRLAER